MYGSSHQQCPAAPVTMIQKYTCQTKFLSEIIIPISNVQKYKLHTLFRFAAAVAGTVFDRIFGGTSTWQDPWRDRIIGTAQLGRSFGSPILVIRIRLRLKILQRQGQLFSFANVIEVFPRPFWFW